MGGRVCGEVNLVNIGEKWGVRNHTFSPAYIFNQLNGGENAGIHIHEAMQLIIDQGVCLMSDMPYNEYDYLTQPTQSQKEKASKYRSLSKGRTKDGDINEMKAAIAVGLPVVVGVPDYPDLHNLNKSNPIYDTIEGETKTYHALCLIGYDDTKNAFKFINSWGTDSGIDGYGYIAYSLIETWRTTGWILYDAKFGQFVDSQFENTELVKYVPIVDADSEVVIAEGITKIGKEAFANQKDISTITFPKTVKQIGDNAFDGCTRLEEISSLERVTSIGTGAFANCSSLTNITIPSGVTYIGNGAFVGCSNAAIAIHASNPNYYAKDNIVYNKAQTKILFAGKIGASPEIPKSVTEVAPYAFRNNGNVEKLYIHGSPEIGAYAFADCANLEEVYCYAYTPPTLDDCAFLNDTFALYAPHSERDAYMAEFDGFVQHASFIPVTIAFVGDGEVVDTQDTYYGANITSLPTPFKTGYTFCGWFDTAACTGTEFTVGGVWDTLADMTIYAKWSPQTYCIQFSGYGCENLADKEVMYDAAIGELPTITRTGYTFYGWKNANGQLYTADTIWLETSNQMLMPDLRVNRDRKSVV